MVAWLDWIYIEALFSAGDKLWNPECLEEIAPEDWPHLHIVVSNSARILTSLWALEDYWEVETIPSSQRSSGQDSKMFLVWRKGKEIKFRKLNESEYQLLELFRSSQNLGFCLSKIDVMGVEESEILNLFFLWMSDGIITEVQVPKNNLKQIALEAQ